MCFAGRMRGSEERVDEQGHGQEVRKNERRADTAGDGWRRRREVVGASDVKSGSGSDD